ncbi:MAG: hypothetical protein WKF84_27175 [Pyrinomonadaceae bacterium]
MLQLPAQERLRLARWLIDSTLDETASEEATRASQPDEPSQAAQWLLSIAGKFSSDKPSNVAECADEILRAEVDTRYGFTRRKEQS